MKTTPTEIVREGLQAILQDDLRQTEAFLAPDVEWVWFEDGGTDCRGRDAVLAAMRERLEGEVLGDVREVRPLGDDDVLVAVEPSAAAAVWGAQALWTRVVVRDGQVVRLVSYDSRERALAS